MSTTEVRLYNPTIDLVENRLDGVYFFCCILQTTLQHRVVYAIIILEVTLCGNK